MVQTKLCIINMADYKLLMFFVFIFFLSTVITKYIIKYSIRHSLIDIPNKRSLHSLPTPRGGGISIASVTVLSVVLFYFIGEITQDVLFALAIGGLLIATVGWIDDHKHIPTGWRALLYFLISLWAVLWISNIEEINIGTFIFKINTIGLLLLILGLSWLINLYNFMDGTDGLASSQAICTGLMAGFLFIISGEKGLAAICFSITAACMGFLIWNWPAAKIFMGDVGSCFIGFTFGVLALVGEKIIVSSLVIWTILLSLFISDATFTLFMRIITKRKWYSAHREHAYQRYVQLGNSHKKLLFIVIILNLLLLWPLALLAYYNNEQSINILILVFLLMFILWSVVQLKYSLFA